ncbi:MAG: hypothetical protein HRU72_02855 [Planctomycetia bacterium]|nr:hypothetical protein [Candidatus Brocadia sp.]QOJ05556.1 MAG: hypothetical protein HRU72_02855 [Planctomycetia bacterium]HQU29917.1 hypothetical protein [Candidatus Brocadia sapporoensis]
MGLRNRWNYSGYPSFITTTVVEWAEVFRVRTETSLFLKGIRMILRLLKFFHEI